MPRVTLLCSSYVFRAWQETGLYIGNPSTVSPRYLLGTDVNKPQAKIWTLRIRQNETNVATETAETFQHYTSIIVEEVCYTQYTTTLILLRHNLAMFVESNRQCTEIVSEHCTTETNVAPHNSITYRQYLLMIFLSPKYRRWPVLPTQTFSTEKP